MSTTPIYTVQEIADTIRILTLIRKLESRLQTTRDQLKACQAKSAPKRVATSDRYCDLCKMSFTSSMKVDCMTPGCKLND